MTTSSAGCPTVTNYWHQRDITNRLIAARQERQAPKADCDEDDGELPPELIELIDAYYRANGLLTQTPIDWMDE